MDLMSRPIGWTPYSSRGLSPQRWEQSQVRVSPQVSLSCHYPTGQLTSWIQGHFTRRDTQPAKTRCWQGGMSLSSFGGCSNRGDFDSMRTQLNLWGPLRRNNNNDKFTSMASFKEAGRNVLLWKSVLRQLRPLVYAVPGENKTLPFHMRSQASSFKHSDNLI